MSGLHSRNKGKRFERFVAKMMKTIYGDVVRRGWQSRSGQDEPDVICPDWWIECKHYAKRVDLYAAIKQSCHDFDRSPDKKLARQKIPIVVHKVDDKPELVTMMMSDFIEVAGRINVLCSNVPNDDFNSYPACNTGDNDRNTRVPSQGEPVLVTCWKGKKYDK